MTLSCRCINGSTLLHTAAYFGLAQQVGQLLALGVDVNLRDYKGATPLHRAKDVECLKVISSSVHSFELLFDMVKIL